MLTLVMEKGADHGIRSYQCVRLCIYREGSEDVWKTKERKRVEACH
jgi:hypothetical protein